jgi:two-component system sensor histidine kinase VicK
MTDPEQHRSGDGAPRSAGAAWLLPAAVPVIALAAIALEGMPAWTIAGGAAATVVAVAFALGVRVRGSSTAAPSVDAAPVPDHAGDLLRRAIEVRCAERTAILEHLTDAVLLVDGHGETRFANAPAREMLGADAATPGTRAAVEALPPQVLRAVQGVSSSPLGERRRIECELRNQDQTPVMVTVTAVKPEPGALAAIVVRNVRAEREADRMKSEFVAKASHELRTPLSSLRAYAELLADGEVTDEAERVRFANVILAETGRLGALVDRMLDISRIESGMARANFESVDLSALAEECVDAQRVDAERRRIALSMGRRSAGAHAVADRTLLKQVMLNLLSNAIKYTPEGGSVSVEVDLDNLARSVVVSVRDTGLGIPPHAVPRLFGKFYRVENHEKVAKGTGLGLNLCRNIVEATHGGQIGVDSQVGVGSRFWFAIPLEQAGRKAA